MTVLGLLRTGTCWSPFSFCTFLCVLALMIHGHRPIVTPLLPSGRMMLVTPPSLTELVPHPELIAFVR